MGMITFLRDRGEKDFKENFRHSAVAEYLQKAIHVLEAVGYNQSNPTPVILAANALHKKLIHYTPALLWEVPSIILQIESDLDRVGALLGEFKVSQDG